MHIPITILATPEQLFIKVLNKEFWKKQNKAQKREAQTSKPSVKNALGKWKSFLPFKAVSSLVLHNIHNAWCSGMSETYPPGQLGLPIALKKKIYVIRALILFTNS